MLRSMLFSSMQHVPRLIIAVMVGSAHDALGPLPVRRVPSLYESSSKSIEDVYVQMIDKKDILMKEAPMPPPSSFNPLDA